MSSNGLPGISMPLAMRKEIEAIPGVLPAVPYRRGYINYNGGRVILESIDVVSKMSYAPCMMAEGSREDVVRLLPDQDNVAASEGFAAKYHIRPGDFLVLSTPSGPSRFGVAAVMVNYMADSGVITVDDWTYRRHWKDSLVDTYWVRVKPGAGVAKTQEAILERFGKERSVFALYNLKFREEVRKIIDENFAVNHAMTILTLVIAGFCTVIALLASVLERTREIGILRSVGMKKCQVSGIILIESALIGIAGGLIGAVMVLFSATSVFGMTGREGI